jgi:hypothetical protein
VTWGKRAISFSFAALLGVAVSVNAPAARGQAEPSQPCDAWRVEYALAANLTLTDTPHRSGDGTYRVGPGRAVLLFRGQDVQLLGYSMQEHFPVQPRSIVGSADIDVNLVTRSDEGCGVAHGVLQGNVLHWTSRVRNYRSDGTTTCEGGLCGKFGAPKEGTNPWGLRPQDVTFGSFTFAPDGKTFTMPNTFVETSKDPQQTAHVALAGREVRRECVPANTCR